MLMLSASSSLLSLKPELKPASFFFCPISINHSSPEALAVSD